MLDPLARAIGILTIAIPSLAGSAEPTIEVPPEIELQQPGVKLSLVAEHPLVVTPTGIDVDGSGRVWAVSSHTHFRPKVYDGPDHDEILIIQPDSSRFVFYNKTDATMDLELSPDFESDGWVYLAERDRILRVRDSDGDGVGDQEESIAVLKTEADYPHNGMSGLAWHPSGDLVFALGENFWKPWTLTARDGTEYTGTGEGGIFRCKPDGSSLRRIAKGFWNPFGVCVRSDGSIFAAENDPGARPPCRLLHVVEGGDYGFQRKYGSAPFHPFVAWNGQLRGTLPMLHSLGEAPCGIAALGNGLLVPSWTDHRIDFYPLEQKGASFATKRITLVTGGLHFRPTCITQTSPTEFYLTDWVYGSYELHKRGRIWKLEIDAEDSEWIGDNELPAPNPPAALAVLLRAADSSLSNGQILSHAKSDDAFIRRAAIDGLSTRINAHTFEHADALKTNDLITLLLAIRKATPRDTNWVKYFLRQHDSQVRFETLRWIADEELQVFSEEVANLLNDPNLGFELFEACLATTTTLAGKSNLGVLDSESLMTRVSDPRAPLRTRAFALRLLDPKLKRFNKKIWSKLYQTGDSLLLTELTRALVLNESDDAQQFLHQLASNESISVATRADAVAGLRGPQVLAFINRSVPRAIRDEALRALRFTPLSESDRSQIESLAERFSDSADLVAASLAPESVKQGRPPATDIAAWQTRLAAIEAPVDLEAGRRVFFHNTVGTCVKCHRYRGRGSAVGPDLSAASNEGDPNRLLHALLQPSRNVDPQYFPRMLITEDGHAFTGIMLRDGGGGNEVYRDSQGRERKFSTSDIVERKELRTSMMPDGLIDLMTDREIRDLLAFLDHQTTNRADPASQN
ncbi:MAG: PVC-type heme-binding CxxCH protein [Rubripirellula sp.]